MFVLTCPNCGHKARVRRAVMGASSMCTTCLQKYKLTPTSMFEDPVHKLTQAAKPSRINEAVESNSETNVLRARIQTFDEELRTDDKVVLEPVNGKSFPMLKTRRQKGLLRFVQSVFHL